LVPAFRIEIEGEDLPRVISNTYTVSLGDKANLRKLLQSWRGKAFTPAELEGFDLKNIVGVPCNIQIIHKNGKGANASKTYANIGSVIPLMKGQEGPKIEGDPVIFDIDTTGPGGAIPDTIPEWIQKRIMDSREYREAVETSIEQPANAAGAPDQETEVTDENCPF
jgi:hypothetical protein